VKFIGKQKSVLMGVLIALSLRKEGFPLSMAEAMLSGCTVITTGSGGTIEISKK
jgi:hypothetical protein